VTRSVGPERKKDEEDNMPSIKERMAEVIQEQPEDATYEEIMRELAFHRMISRGLEDSRAGRVTPNDEMGRRIRTWQK
jgi:predicted transcriptional regulator